MANGHGGKRVGSGRKPKPRAADPEVNKLVKALQEAPPGTPEFEDVQDWVMAVLRREEHPDATIADKTILAQLLIPYQMGKVAEGGAKVQRVNKAAAASQPGQRLSVNRPTPGAGRHN